MCSECNKNIYLLNIIGHMCPYLDLSIFIETKDVTKLKQRIKTVYNSLRDPLLI